MVVGHQGPFRDWLYRRPVCPSIPLFFSSFSLLINSFFPSVLLEAIPYKKAHFFKVHDVHCTYLTFVCNW